MNYRINEATRLGVVSTSRVRDGLRGPSMTQTTALASPFGKDWRREQHPTWCAHKWGCEVHTSVPIEVRSGFGPTAVVAAEMDDKDLWITMVLEGKYGSSTEEHWTLREADLFADRLLADAESSDLPLVAAASQALAAAFRDQIIRARTQEPMVPGAPGAVAA